MAGSRMTASHRTCFSKRQRAFCLLLMIALLSIRTDIAAAPGGLSEADGPLDRPFRLQMLPRFSEAFAALRAGDYATTLDRLEAQADDLATAEEHAQHRYLQGMALLGLGRIKPAGLAFIRIIALHPHTASHGFALFRLAQIHVELDRYDVSVELYREIQQLPSGAYTTEPRARAAARLRQFELADTSWNLPL